ncbi:hypothetical protein E1B28_001573 [Marasmius oreades]|uniref:Aminotransferase class IV n=1 Tax=Marasmius oreades TaxID=181124 RepID=A0A9P7V3P3_9AGAR|nr:uncharacterized protein E1B28_001573 [Marasmius oreades]KAG7099760.1 hypothetical protein E1B28_001573 [Marasmius oreades]
MYQLLSSISYDTSLLSLGWNNDHDTPSPFLQLPYHHDRLLDGAERHGWSVSLAFSELKEKCLQAVKATKAKDGLALKLRITLSSTGELSITTSPIPPLKLDPLSEAYFLPPPQDDANSDSFGVQNSGTISLTLDTLPTPSSIFTSTKTTQRPHYDAARARAGLKSYTDPVDVILFNEQGLITETSIANIAFYRSPYGWLTPAKETGCLEGIMRRKLLEERKIKEDREGTLKKENLKDREEVLVFNGVFGCQRARISLR